MDLTGFPIYNKKSYYLLKLDWLIVRVLVLITLVMAINMSLAMTVPVMPEFKRKLYKKLNHV
jgi:hypothetical protein